MELRPKVGVAPVLFLLSYGLHPRAWREPAAPLSDAADLAEALVPLFARAASAALRSGLLHGYREEQETLATVRGPGAGEPAPPANHGAAAAAGPARRPRCAAAGFPGCPG